MLNKLIRELKKCNKGLYLKEHAENAKLKKRITKIPPHSKIPWLLVSVGRYVNQKAK